MENTCPMSPDVHFTPASKAFQMEKCVISKLTKMNDHKKCTAYHAGICNANNLGACSLKDIDTMCNKLKTEFTVQDAQELCALEQIAGASFWQNKYNK